MTIVNASLRRGRSRTAPILAALALICATTDAGAQAPNPSFNCGKARTADEKAICGDARLAELDRAVALAFTQVPNDMREGARAQAKELLAARRQCGADRLCILEQQVTAIETFSGSGSKVPVPPWVGAYRIALVTARGMPADSRIPARVGSCAVTQITEITTRFGEKLGAPPSANDADPGSAVNFANQGHQVSYSYVRALAESRVGDEVLMCLVSIPKDCPPGDERGRVYSGTNLRTKGSWLLPDAQHSCGGA